MNRFLISDVVAPPIPVFKQRAKEIQQEPPKKYDLTQAVPSFPTFGRIKKRLISDLEMDEVCFYTDVAGLPELRSRIACRHPLSKALAPDNIMVTAGANHAMFTALLLYFTPGDKVGLVEPYYFNYDMALKMLGMQPTYVPLDEADGFTLNAAAVIGWLEKNPVKGLILVSPNNPTGAVYGASELVRLLEWTSPRGIELILDETYLRFDASHLRDSRLGRFIGKGLSLVGSFSKTYSLTGYRVGYLCASVEQIGESLKIQDTLVICASHLGQRAAIHGIDYCEADVAAKVGEMSHLAELMRESFSSLRNFKLASVGAFFAYVRHPFEGMDGDMATLETYRRTGLLGLPGTVFGPNQQKYIRFAFCNLDFKTLRAALDQLRVVDQKI